MNVAAFLGIFFAIMSVAIFVFVFGWYQRRNGSHSTLDVDMTYTAAVENGTLDNGRVR